MTFSEAIRSVLLSLVQRWRLLFATDVLFKAVAFLLLTPLASGVLHLSLWIAGSGTLADADILLFFIRPFGWAVLVAFGAVSLGIIALEQATLLALLRAPSEQPVGLAAAVTWALGRSRAVVGLAARFVAIMALVAAPFLGVAALIATSLLGEFDINYYLAEQPPKFQVAVACGVGLLGGYVAVVAWLLSGWLLALPVVLFEQLPARDAFAESRRRVAGSRRLVLGLVLCWGAASLLAGSLFTSAVVMAARQLVPLSTGTLPGLVLAIGLTLLAWFAAGLLVNLLATTSFAALLAESYRRLSPLEPTAMPPAVIATERVPWAVRLTRWRMLAGLTVGCFLIAALGAVAAKQVRFDDDVEVMGHRGAGGLRSEEHADKAHPHRDDLPHHL